MRYPPLPKMKKKKGVKKKFVGGLLGRRAARQRAKEEGLTGKELRKAGRQGFMSGTGLGRIAGAVQGFRANKGMGFKERLRGAAAGAAGGFNNRANAGLAERIQSGYGDRLNAMQNPEVAPELEETDAAMTDAVGGGVDTSAAGAGMDSGGNIAAKRGGLVDRRRRRKQNGGMFEMTKKEKDKAKVEVIKGTRTKKEERESKRDERRVGRKVKRYKRVGERRKKSDRQGAGEVGLNIYKEKLRNRAKRERKRKARRQKVRDFGSKVKAASQARRAARRNRRKERSSSGSGCQGAGCGAYE